ncbi:galactosyl transferase GMA12/MNN10 family-domain-containing protein [Cladochytrium replicatum]|nr:galactosyl transferase GMA12/MNN10 family-domain-containing protein [Cladochytrium replicatum]
MLISPRFRFAIRARFLRISIVLLLLLSFVLVASHLSVRWQPPLHRFHALATNPTASSPLKFAVLTVVIPRTFDPLLTFFHLQPDPSLTIRNKLAYCRRHGYDCLIVRQSSASHPSWEKVHSIARWMQDYDWIWAIDADALVMNKDFDLPSIIAEASASQTPDLIIARDYDDRVFNAGSFLIRTGSKDTPQLVRKWLELEHNVPRFKFLEQDALSYLYTTDYAGLRSRTVYVPMRAFNSYCAEHEVEQFRYRQGDFVVHFPGQCKHLLIQFLNDHRVDLVK